MTTTCQRCAAAAVGVGAVATGAVVSYRHTRLNIRFQPTSTTTIADNGTCQIRTVSPSEQSWRQYVPNHRPWVRNQFRIDGHGMGVRVGLSTLDRNVDYVIRDVEAMQTGQASARPISVEGHGWTCRALGIVPTVTSLVVDDTRTHTTRRWTLDVVGGWQVTSAVRHKHKVLPADDEGSGVAVN